MWHNSCPQRKFVIFSHYLDSQQYEPHFKIANLYGLSVTVISRTDQKPQPILMRNEAFDVQFMVFPG
jgi:hypothetical protein